MEKQPGPRNPNHLTRRQAAESGDPDLVRAAARIASAEGDAATKADEQRENAVARRFGVAEVHRVDTKRTTGEHPIVLPGQKVGELRTFPDGKKIEVSEQEDEDSAAA